jgi:MFS family permease
MENGGSFWVSLDPETLAYYTQQSFRQAINSAMYQIGGISALPFVGPAIDTWGRRVGMMIGAILIVLGVIVNGTTLYNPGDIGQLQGGRFVLGFGVSIVSSAGPIYVVETAHPAWRGIITAYCNTFWFVGSILAGGACRGALNLTGNVSWQVPIWLQVRPWPRTAQRSSERIC